ncbi:Phenol 2-monooxygenase fsqG [Cladobotryum mycophilum]|uniref:Phenol 2-monooxygenase fsqG n=1 Tax=Cladobotryum mycophilum TaxID=491253 RepID=A0ABR0SVH7_9HYPO
MVTSALEDGKVEVVWKKQPVDLQVDLEAIEDPLAYPITVLVRNANDKNAPLEVIQARYLIACDGARSWTRKHLKIPLVGDLTDSTWGVMDIVPRTNFPDIRKVCVIHSTKGTVMAVPREDKLVRCYIGMDGGGHDATAALDRHTPTFDNVMDSARSIISPYTFKAGRVAWWSAYQVGQRVANEFSRHNRVFLTGDAVQRRPIAQQLIDFDREYLELFANPNLDSDGFLAAYLEAMKFTTGIGIRYALSLVVQPRSRAKETSTVAKKLSPGMRLPDFQMVNQSDGVPVTIHHRLVMNGQFRIVVFTGDISKESIS